MHGTNMKKKIQLVKLVEKYFTKGRFLSEIDSCLGIGLQFSYVPWETP